MPNGTHTLTELRAIRGFYMLTNGIVLTRYGKRTLNRWREAADGKYYNFSCSTLG